SPIQREGDVPRGGIGGRHGELSQGAGGAQPADLVAAGLAEPQGVVAAARRGDAQGGGDAAGPRVLGEGAASAPSGRRLLAASAPHLSSSDADPDVARLAGQHVPAIYGPSGDVKWAEADPTYSVAAAKRGGKAPRSAWLILLRKSST